MDYNNIMYLNGCSNITIYFKDKNLFKTLVIIKGINGTTINRLL